jgi:hypothetical protein
MAAGDRHAHADAPWALLDRSQHGRRDAGHRQAKAKVSGLQISAGILPAVAGKEAVSPAALHFALGLCAPRRLVRRAIRSFELRPIRFPKILRSGERQPAPRPDMAESTRATPSGSRPMPSEQCKRPAAMKLSYI